VHQQLLAKLTDEEEWQCTPADIHGIASLIAGADETMYGDL
jgi:hypothetical protein